MLIFASRQVIGSEFVNSQLSSQNTLIHNNIVYWSRNYDKEMTYDLLSLVLSKTRDIYGEAVIERGPNITQGRAIIDLKDGGAHRITIVNVVPDADREENLRPIYIASDAGLIGLRVCIINKDDAERFKRVRTLKDIEDNQIVFGQGEHWPDTQILRDNGLKVVTSAQYKPLYGMLKARRFNCFLRGVSEVLGDYARYGDDGLMIEENLLFSYPSASLFFVNKNSKVLAARLELGLRRAIIDGSFADYYDRHLKGQLNHLNLSKRRIFRLNNSLISDEMLESLTRSPMFKDAKINVF